MSPSLRSVLRAALAGAIAAATASPARAADKVVVGTGGSASDAPFYLAQDKGFFKDEGLEVDLIVLDSGAKVIAPLGTGELDVGSGALSVGFWNALIRGVKFSHCCRPRAHRARLSLPDRVHAQGSDRQRPVQEP